MSWLCEKNNFLTLRPGAIITPRIDGVLVAYEPYFAGMGVHREVTSGYRSPMSQLTTILNMCEQAGIECNVQPSDVAARDNAGQYVWRMAWGALLLKGFIVNPPFACPCPVPYIRKATGEDMYGKIMNATPHSVPPPDTPCFDLGIRTPGKQDYNFDLTARVLDSAKTYWEKIGIRDYLLEHAQDCCHINLLPL